MNCNTFVVIEPIKSDICLLPDPTQIMLFWPKDWFQMHNIILRDLIQCFGLLMNHFKLDPKDSQPVWIGKFTPVIENNSFL